ncbi:hypothetical protein VTN00DRAFT_10122 [Thermoascus crustaceus]|uniref:uncharacterized protein n=1 Tax=Thermoascus crustaceus TaxID=5088 RepID=UPI003741F02A
MPSTTTPTATTTTESMDTELCPNFAQPKSSSSNRLSIGYDHEVYLQLTAGEKAAEKTPNQIYMEERARRLTLRAQDPAVSGPQAGPSSIDFECAENQLKQNNNNHNNNTTADGKSKSKSK